MLSKSNLVEGINIDKGEELNFCEGCVQGKQHRKTFLKGGSYAKKMLELVHTNIWGPAKIPSFCRVRYFVSFIDNYSCKSFIYILKNKGQCVSKFQKFKVFVGKQTREKLKILKSDNRGEFTN